MKSIWSRFNLTKFSYFALMLFSVLLISCSQSRNGIGKKKKSEIWGAQQVCDIMPGSELLGCFSVELNIGMNQANISVIDLGIDPLKVPYRVLARRPEDVAFTVLSDNVMADIGRSFVVNAASKHYIEAYEEWRFETIQSIAVDGVGFIDAKAGKGVPLAQVRIFWPELNLPPPK